MVESNCQIQSMLIIWQHGMKQTIMLGFDGTKDGGYLMAN
jgi:phosphoenolpyruvate carboxylase